ncbi:MAG TPA: hypothetical protein VHY82_02970 [Acetobacteraceae bacterium]|nr:hypothetical protein [Acetobacteraceae bacterium]
MPDIRPNRVIIGISGPSGLAHGIRLLQTLRNTPYDAHGSREER